MPKNVLILSNDKPESKDIKTRLVKYLKNTAVLVNNLEVDPDIIVSIGGDGTLLSTFHQFKSHINTARFIGIHTGHLGFYADWQGYEVQELAAAIVDANGESISYPLLEIDMELTDGTRHKELALNEFSIRSVSGTMVSEIYIKDHFFETFRGDGICVATPTGSTGLNKSLGGAVIHPRLDAIQLTEIASINNRVFRSLGSPMIIPRDEWFELKPQVYSNNKNMIVSIDNMAFSDKIISCVKLKVANERIHFASFKHTHFWDRVKNSFIGLSDNEANHKNPDNYLK
ncbi:NAD kinase [Fundicoccus sp. Sow4_H7]|uniref:NAD kinase n=1 Tax=Fundicoccus sp. Sow4_H7 TaxID=3438784 RepID=UPI003F8E7CE6